MDYSKFSHVRSKKIERIDGASDFIHLYECGNNPNILDLINFCKENMEQREDRFFFVIAFFDKRENSGFPTDPISAGYGDDVNLLRHIQALYTYNQVNGYSKLAYYETNAYESTTKEIVIC